MRSSIFFNALWLVPALASPIQKRALTTEVEVVTLTEFVTLGATPSVEAATAAPPQETPDPLPAPPPPETSAPPPPPVETPPPPPPTTEAPAPAPTTSEVPAPAPPPPQPASFSEGGSGYQDMVLYHHNVHRSNHSASPLVWSAELEASAYEVASSCVYGHNTGPGGGGYGQNIGYGIPAANIGQMLTNMMFNDEYEFFQFGVSDPSDFERWGHFSQMLWKDTTHVACATVECTPLANSPSGETNPFTVCNYSPPGNFGGQYGNQVGLGQGAPILFA